MILRTSILLLGSLTAAPVELESNGGPVPERAILTELLARAPDPDTAADLLLKHYNDHGYPAVGVDVNDEESTRVVSVDVSRYGQIALSDGPKRTQTVATKTFQQLANRYVNQNKLKSLLRGFHANPLHRVVPQLQPNADGTRVNALLKIEQSQSARYSAGFHDSGARPLPRERFWVQGKFSDLWNRNSLSTARLTLGSNPEEFHALQFGSRFFTPNDHEWSVHLSYSGASGDQLGSFDAYTWQVSAQWQGQQSKWGDWKTRSTIGLAFRRSNNALEFGNFTNRGLANTFQISLRQTFERNWERSLTRVNASLVLSPFGDDSEHASLRPGVSAQYGILRTSVWHRHDLPKGWDFIASLAGQWSSDPVLQADQLALGGSSGLRGLREQFALGDSGYLGGLELRTPVINFAKDWRLRPLIFLQTGETFDQIADNSTTATTAGIGLQIGRSQTLRASLHAGWRLDEGGGELHSQLTWNF